jgi:hypothetical protein
LGNYATRFLQSEPAFEGKWASGSNIGGHRHRYADLWNRNRRGHELEDCVLHPLELLDHGIRRHGAKVLDDRRGVDCKKRGRKDAKAISQFDSP